jgi:hypothetical protein
MMNNTEGRKMWIVTLANRIVKHFKNADMAIAVFEMYKGSTITYRKI